MDDQQPWNNPPAADPNAAPADDMNQPAAAPMGDAPTPVPADDNAASGEGADGTTDADDAPPAA